MDYQDRELLKEILLLQRISLVLQCERIAAGGTPPDKSEKDQARFIAEAVGQGHLWAIEWENDWLRTVPSSTADEVGNILTMWRMIVWGFDELSQSEKEQVFREADPPFLSLTITRSQGLTEIRSRPILL